MKRMENIDASTAENLIAAAKRAREKAYAPYSNYKVGAALLAEDGRVFTGCNVENASFGLTVCAERNAVAAAIQAGSTGFRAIAIVVDDTSPAAPCGACRQVLAEFKNDLHVILANLEGKRKDCVLSELIPELFTFK